MKLLPSELEHNTAVLTGEQRMRPTENASHEYRRTRSEQTRSDHSYAVNTHRQHI